MAAVPRRTTAQWPQCCKKRTFVCLRQEDRFGVNEQNNNKRPQSGLKSQRLQKAACSISNCLLQYFVYDTMKYISIVTAALATALRKP
jgi:hypothetical protein